VCLNIAEHTLVPATSQGESLQWTPVTNMVQDKGSALDSSDHHGTRLAVDTSDHNGTMQWTSVIIMAQGMQWTPVTAVVGLLNQYMCEYSYITRFLVYIFFIKSLKVM